MGLFKKVIILFFVVLNFSVLIQAQNVLFIDFEEIQNSLPQEGLLIGNQFFDTHGIQFLLEDGRVPVLSRIGNPVTAFSSAWGFDTPAPNQNIGNFFLTDNGTLSGLSSPPLIITFQTPIQKIEGDILDIDFDETFVIQGRDENENIVLSDTVRSGDPGTGDGLATHWVLENDNCIAIHSVRFEGKRQDQGAFGLGLDNFIFHFMDSDFKIELSTSTTPADCGTANGTLTILASGGTGELLYFVGNNNIQANPEILNLTAGTYELTVMDQLGCRENKTIFIHQNNCPVYIPNAFSPNDDGLNDFFKIYPHPQFAGHFHSLQIFNRWGALVFMAENFNAEKNKWDGYFKGKKVNPGVYVYLLKLTFEDGNREMLSGDITILR